MDSSGADNTLVILPVQSPAQIFSLLEAFHRKAGDCGYTLAHTVGQMSVALSDPLQRIRAVWRGRRPVAYVWAQVAPDHVFLYQVYSGDHEAAKMLYTDLEQWARSVGARSIRGLASRTWLRAAERVWGFRPKYTLVERRV